MISRRPLILGAAAASLIAPRSWAQAADFQGEWNGLLNGGGSTALHLRMVVSPGPRVMLYSVDQGNAAIPGANAQIDGSHLTVAFPGVRGSFDGRLEHGRIVGTFTQGASAPLTFQRGALPPPPPPPALTASDFAALRAQCGAPGMGAAASRRDGQHIAFATGLRAIGHVQQVTTADKWHLGSITKSMTATLVARCAEAGVVSWDDTVGSILGAAAPGMRAEYHDVNFRHLCSHRSGLPANLDVSDINTFARENADARADRIQYARLALVQTPVGPKGDTFLYSNSGYVIAAAMLEVKLNATWEAILRERVFTPLDMAGAGFGAPGTRNMFDQPTGHQADSGGALHPVPPGAGVTDNPAVLGPAGRVHAPLDDVLKYLTAHRDASSPFLTRASWDLLHTPPFGGDYAMGWVRRGSAYWHNGSNTLWYAEAQFDPSNGVASVAAANDGDVGHIAPAISTALQAAAQAVLSPPQ